MAIMLFVRVTWLPKACQTAKVQKEIADAIIVFAPSAMYALLWSKSDVLNNIRSCQTIYSRNDFPPSSSLHYYVQYRTAVCHGSQRTRRHFSGKFGGTVQQSHRWISLAQGTLPKSKTASQAKARLPYTEI